MALAFFTSLCWGQASTPPFNVGMAFAPTAIGWGGTSQLTLTLTNSAIYYYGNYTSVSGTVTGPSFLAITAPQTNCAGMTVTPTSGGFTFSGGTIPLSTSCTITVTATVMGTPGVGAYQAAIAGVNFVSNSAPYTSSGATAGFTVTGGVPPTITSYPPYSDELGRAYDFQVTATGTPPIEFSATGLPPGLTINPATGEITGTPTKVGSYAPTLKATNAYLPPATQSFDMNIYLPPLSVTKVFAPASINTGSTSTMTIKLVNNEVEESFNGLYFLDPFPAGMTAVPSTSHQCGGTVTVTTNSLTLNNGSLPSGETCVISAVVTGKSDRTVTLTNTTGNIYYCGECSAPGASGTLTVVAQSPQITSGPPPGSAIGANYVYAITVTGTAPIAVTVSGLPPGLKYNAASHTITGTPTTKGNFPGSIKASNGIPPDATQSYTIPITAPPLAITTKSLPPITSGPVSVQIQAIGGIPPYTFAVQGGQVPPGLTLAPSGLLTGTPKATGTFSFTVQATDSVGTKAIQPYSLTISQLSAAFNFAVTPDPAVAGQPVVIAASLSGGAGAASGQVQVWVAHSNERCPQTPGTAPIAALTSTANLSAAGQAQFSFPNLPIDNYQVCGAYAGNSVYAAETAGPIDLFVIKGVVLASPAVTIAAPQSVKIGTPLAAQVTVTPPANAKGVPGGSVVLRANGATVGTLPLAGGAAVFSTMAPGVPGSVVLTASYYGDGAYSPAVSAATSVRIEKELLLLPDPDPIPTLSEMGLALLMALVTLAGAQGLMRRRAGR